MTFSNTLNVNYCVHCSLVAETLSEKRRKITKTDDIDKFREELSDSFKIYQCECCKKKVAHTSYFSFREKRELVNGQYCYECRGELNKLNIKLEKIRIDIRHMWQSKDDSKEYKEKEKRLDDEQSEMLKRIKMKMNKL